MKKIIPALLCIIVLHCNAQTRIDGTFPFQSDPNKKYSLYIPSTYNIGTPNRLMIGFHPFNTARWNAISWCDTLLNFSEANGLILACPDGGLDGQVDHSIDTAFTSALIDSVLNWYNVDVQKIYAMGFSVGGRATYTYGLYHHNIFGGFIPIGAAINGTNEVNSVIQNSSGKPYYLVHGGNDNPGVRFIPILNALNANNAIVNSILMPGVGHTIDFPNRNQILTTAFQWVDSVNCANLSTSVPFKHLNNTFRIYPTVIGSDNIVNIKNESENEIEILLSFYDLNGKRIIKQKNYFVSRTNTISYYIPKLASGVYILKLCTDFQEISQKIIVP